MAQKGLRVSAALKSQSDGVAIAAPQIGYSLPIFVVSGKIFHEDFIKGEEEFDKVPQREIPKDLVFINPKISKLSRDKETIRKATAKKKDFCS